MLKARFIVFCLITANAVSIEANSEEKYHLRSIMAPPSPAPSPTEAWGGGESGGGVGEEVVESNHHLPHHHRHHGSVEKSVAGGGAIVGVLAAVFVAAVFCYIRATRRRRHVQLGSPADSSSDWRKVVDQAGGSRVHP